MASGLGLASNGGPESLELEARQGLGEHVSSVGSSGDPGEDDSTSLCSFFEEEEAHFEVTQAAGELLLVPGIEGSLVVARDVDGEVLETGLDSELVQPEGLLCC